MALRTKGSCVFCGRARKKEEIDRQKRKARTGIVPENSRMIELETLITGWK